MGNAPVASIPPQPAMEEAALVMPYRMPAWRGARSWWLLPRPADWKPPSASVADSSAREAACVCCSPVAAGAWGFQGGGGGDSGGAVVER